MKHGRGDVLRLAMAVAALLVLASCSGNNNSTPSSSPSSGSSNASTTPTPSAVTIYPGSASVAVNGKVQFTAFAASQPTSSFTWTVSGGGTINATTGAFTASASPTTTPVTVTATSSAGSSVTGTATLNVTAAQGVLISPAVIAMPAGTTQAFAATVNGSAAVATWQVNGTTGGDGLHGTIDSSGTYTAPRTPPPSGATTITAITGSGSSTVSGTATVAVVFSNASLNGSYAFSYKGNNSSGFTAVAGSFIAQGTSGAAGQIFGGVQDVLTAGTASAAHSQFTGTFSVNPDGTGTATLPNSVAWEFALVSDPVGGASRQALLIRFDTSSTGSGTINAQNPALLTASAFSGNYAFGLSGVDSTGAALVIAGRFFADGVGTIPPGSAIQDINDNGKSTLTVTGTSTTTTTTTTTSTSTSADTSLQGSFQMDASSPNSGRGTLTFSSTNTTVLSGTTTLQFAFYIVDNTHIKAVEIDNKAALAGDFYSAANTPTDGAINSAAVLPNGNYAFTVSGTGTNGAYAAGGVLAASGATTTGTAGSIAGVLDVNNGVSDIRLNSTITASTYSVDQNFGRITWPLTVNGTTANFAGYTAAYNTPTGPVLFVELIELDAKAIAGGTAFPQTASPLQGSYSLNLAGATGPKNGAVEQDVIGQVTTLGSTSFNGNLYINNFALNTVTPHLSLTSSTAVVSPASNGRGTTTLAVSVATFPLAYYVVDANSALVLETDGARVVTGILSKQF
jgi:hypothetical protein